MWITGSEYIDQRARDSFVLFYEALCASTKFQVDHARALKVSEPKSSPLRESPGVLGVENPDAAIRLIGSFEPDRSRHRSKATN